MLESREIDAVTEVGSKAVITETDEKPEHDRIENLTAVDSVAELNHGASALEKRVLRKLDWRVIPLVNTLYLLSYLDRSNIGNAKIAGMQTDLNLSSNDYAWLLTIYYISFIVFEPFVLMWKLVPPHMWAAAMVTGWGLLATLQAATQSWAGMMACRFFLGVTEAGLGLGVIYYLSFFYMRDELGFRIGLQLACAPLASTFAGALAFGITSGHSALANWRLLFIVEGLPSVVAGAVTWFFLPDSPLTARFLTEEEKAVVLARGVRQVGDEAAQRLGHIRGKHVLEAIMDWKNWITAMMYFSCNVSFSSLPVFLPTILTEMGFNGIDSQGLTAPPYLLSFFITIGTTYLADRTQQRGIIIICLSIIGATGYVVLATTTGVAPRYTGVFLAAGGVFPVIANILPWVLNNQGSDTKRGAGITILNIIGQCGPLLGTRVFPGNQAPYYKVGMSVCAGFMFFNALLALLLRTLLSWENRKLDAKYGTLQRQSATEMMGSEERQKWAAIGEENEGPRFRYIL